jgi:hypothetical protein
MPEFFVELVKAIGSIGDVNHEPSINMLTYAAYDVSIANGESATAINGTTFSHNFMLGFDCEIYANADRDSIFSGMNTVKKDIYWQLSHAAQDAAVNVRYDFYAMYDAVFVCENGNMDVRF